VQIPAWPGFVILFFQLVTVSEQFAFKVKRRGGAGNIFDFGSIYLLLIQLEFPVIGTEIDHATWRYGPERFIEQFGMIALNVEEIFHAFAVAECGRVHHYQVE
jgi:hypothetical protein